MQVKNIKNLLSTFVIAVFGLLLITPAPAFADHGEASITTVYCTEGRVIQINLDNGNQQADHYQCIDEATRRAVGSITIGNPSNLSISQIRVLFAYCDGRERAPNVQTVSTGDSGFTSIRLRCGTNGQSNAISSVQSTVDNPPNWYHEDESNADGDGAADGAAEEVVEVSECLDGPDGFAASQAGNCVDSFTRCPIDHPNSDLAGRYAVVDSRGDCFPINNADADDTPLSENPILIYMGRLIVFLSGGVGIILVITVIIAGIRYSLARGNPQETAAAKGMIEKVAISAILYLFAFAIINWLIPGGLLSGSQTDETFTPGRTGPR